MSNETPRPPQAAEHENTATMMAPTATPLEVAPASVTPTGQPGARRKMGKSGPPGPAMKGRSVAKRKPEKKRPASTGVKRAAARKKNTRAGEASSFREKAGWKTEPKVGGRKPSADQKRGPTKKAGPARKTLAKRAAAKTATATRRPLTTAKRAPAAARRATAKRTTGRR
jgi:DNA-binding protein HU-beta